jgi:3',5'-cyclic-AMP phosphodiesterase
VQVFAVEDTAVQLHWSSLPARRMTLEIGPETFDVEGSAPAWYRTQGRRKLRDAAGGPGAVQVAGLEPDTAYDVVASGEGVPKRRVAVARTLPPPPGRLLARFATISDCHIGERRLGLTRTLHDPRPRPRGLAPYAVRCAVAAIGEAEAWGAETLVVKGDLTREAEPEEAETIADILEDTPLSVQVTLGNHDVRGPADVAAVVSSRGIPASSEARAVDLPGLRLVLGHSPVRGLHGGRLERTHLRELAELAGSAPGPVALVVHHPPQRRRLPTHYPPSLSWADTSVLIDSLSAATSEAVVLSGHSHRNRRYRVGNLTVAEVGSTKDYPGQWAGYAVYEGGIRQVVMRTAAADVIAWTEMTGLALGGLWAWWSRGSLADRCWTLEWPDRVVTPQVSPAR